MISWIQQNFQQHFRTIFIFILGVVIIAFVFTIGSTPGFGDADQKTVNRPFFKINLASERDRREVARKAELSMQLQFRQVDPLQRVALLSLADDLKIPSPNDAELTEYIKGLRRFNLSGTFDANQYNQFKTSLPAQKISEAEVLEVAAEDYRISKVEKLLNGPGYVLDADIRRALERVHTSWTLSIASIDEGSFNPTIKATDEELKAYFGSKEAEYEIPPQARVKIVEFPAAKYLGSVQVDEGEIREHYRRNAERYPKAPPRPQNQTPKAGQVTPPSPTSDPEADFAIARPLVESDVRKAKAVEQAGREATKLTVDLDQKEISHGLPALDAYLASRGLAPKALPPFGRTSLPAELKVGPDAAAEVFKLNKSRYFTDALMTDNGAVVVFWEETLPARRPDFAEVREKVRADYLANEKRKRFVEHGNTLKTQIAARMKAGEPFDKAVAGVSAANNVKAETKAIPAFTLRQRPADLAPEVEESLTSLKSGDLSAMIVGGDNKGRLVYIAERKSPDSSEANPEYVSFAKRAAEYYGNVTGQGLLVDLVEKEDAKSRPAVAAR